MTRILNAASGLRPPGFACGRTGPATYIDSGGVLRTAAANVERIDYTSDGKLLGLANEPAQTNLVPTRFSDSAYGFTDCTMTGGQADPAGGTNAYLFQPKNNTGSRVNIRNGVYGQAGAYREFLWVKAYTAADVGKRYSLYAYTNQFVGVYSFTLTANWQRVNTSWTQGGSTIYINMPGSETGTNDICNFYIFGAELKAGADVFDSFIDGVTANGTRAADAYSFTLASTATALTFTFDDASTQTISGLTGGSTYTIPTSLNRSRIMYIDDNVSSGGSSYALAAGAGAYTLTGRVATFNRLYGLAAAAGSIVLTGRVASQSLGRSSTRVTFALTGRPASRAQIRPATPASFALVGGQTSTARARSLLAGVGLFALTGGSARQAQGRSASPGSLTVTGQPIAQGHIFTLACNGGSVAVTGRATARSLGRFGSAATFTVAGIASAKTVGRLASGGTRTVTGGASSRGLGRFSAPVSFAVTGLSAARALSLSAPSTAPGTVTGRPTSFASGRFASPGAFVLSGVAAGLRSLRGLTAGSGTFGTTGFASGYTNSHVSGYTLGAGSGQYGVRMFGDGSAKQLPFMKRKRVRFGLSP